ncbi:MAG: hypothetical protein IJL21_01535 [Alphaproteobacteria bacterium]|nr:hypothetical protein [Alphaproteobacteria bacterium]MBQ7128133.1 hypothetical protein [Alphaproteobacteria bacterium]
MVENKKYQIDLRKGRVNCPNIEQRIGDLLAKYAYNFAVDYGFELYESDVQWIENNISKNSQNNIRDIFWQVDDAYTNGKKHSKFLLDYLATFFEQFIDTPDIPANVNRLLIYIVGKHFAHYKIKINSAPYQHFSQKSGYEKLAGGKNKYNQCAI